MSCFYPLKAFDVGHVTQNGKPKLKVCPRGTSVQFDKNGKPVEGIDIPCGRCSGCRLDYSRDWAVRAHFESLSYPPDYSWFVTLTYDNDHLPKSFGFKKDTGEVFNSSTLNVKDYLLFFKRLRTHYKRQYDHVGIRFILSGEYGDRTYRPHYHALIFNMPLSDLVPTDKRNGNQYYASKFLTDL